jgi:tetratricopeptide (TPR) repeat protein
VDLAGRYLYSPPIYISTPHPINEAFRVGQLALARNILDLALENLQQAALIEPESADILYAIGEIYRLQGEPIKALSAYESAVEIDGDFAPAYLGRARLMRQLDPKAEVQEDLEQAIDLDPDLESAARIDRLSPGEGRNRISSRIPGSCGTDHAWITLVHLYLARHTCCRRTPAGP